jgi:L-ascorbate metabolism protein UlaG (beta-lactamase superfamily)
MITRDKNKWVPQEVKQAKPLERVFGSKIISTFINHASVLIQTEGLNIITDPIFAGRASPVNFAGPRRFAPPGVAFDDVPSIDIILLSHNHYDHMDLKTLRKLVKKHNPLVITSLGNKEFLKSKGIEAVELDWWQSHTHKHIHIDFVPAQHFSARAISDRDKTLWGGFVLRLPNGDVYFAGDTGYGDFVTHIKRKYPKGFKLGFVPIGAFKPEWFMSHVHMGPLEALAFSKELRIENSVAIHFGTFKLADDAQHEPAELLKTASDFQKVSNFVALKSGEYIVLE